MTSRRTLPARSSAAREEASRRGSSRAHAKGARPEDAVTAARTPPPCRRPPPTPHPHLCTSPRTSHLSHATAHPRSNPAPHLLAVVLPQRLPEVGVQRLLGRQARQALLQVAAVLQRGQRAVEHVPCTHAHTPRGPHSEAHARLLRAQPRVRLLLPRAPRTRGRQHWGLPREGEAPGKLRAPFCAKQGSAAALPRAKRPPFLASRVPLQLCCRWKGGSSERGEAGAGGAQGARPAGMLTHRPARAAPACAPGGTPPCPCRWQTPRPATGSARTASGSSSSTRRSIRRCRSSTISASTTKQQRQQQHTGERLPSQQHHRRRQQRFAAAQIILHAEAAKQLRSWRARHTKRAPHLLHQPRVAPHQPQQRVRRPHGVAHQLAQVEPAAAAAAARPRAALALWRRPCTHTSTAFARLLAPAPSACAPACAGRGHQSPHDDARPPVAAVTHPVRPLTP